MKNKERIYRDINDATYNFIMSSIIEYLSNNQTFIYDLREYFSSSCPSDIEDVLETLGWEREDFESNGWQQDTWYYYSHTDYSFELVLNYSGFYGDLKLYRSDIDD